jgi:hypothetical protein
MRESIKTGPKIVFVEVEETQFDEFLKAKATAYGSIFLTVDTP